MPRQAAPTARGPAAAFGAGLAAFVAGLNPACTARMLRHLRSGRFARVRVARGVVAGPCLAAPAVFGLVFISPI